MKTLAQKIKEDQAKNLIKLIGYFGSQAKLAAHLDVTPQAVQGWILRGRISAKMAIQSELVTGNFLSREQLRPDVINWEK
jgi:DNA-binding transcriptional regulator YdaS (Cro superfamily)